MSNYNVNNNNFPIRENSLSLGINVSCHFEKLVKNRVTKKL